MNRSPVFTDLIYAQYSCLCSQYKFWKNTNNRLTDRSLVRFGKRESFRTFVR
jgi:hypothetical protein